MPSYQHTAIGTTSKVTSEDIKAALKKASENIRLGVGARSRVLLAHPDNADRLNAILKKITEVPDIHLVKPYRVLRDRNLPKEQEIKTGNVIWNDTKLWKWSEGPHSDITPEEYLRTAVYFGWAVEEIKKVEIFYELDMDTFSTVWDGAMVSVMQEGREKLNDKIAREVFTDYDFMFTNPEAAKRILT